MRLAASGLAAWLCGAPAQAQPYELEPVAFASMPGFAADSHAAALQSFIKTCTGRTGQPSGAPHDLFRACAAARRSEAAKNPRGFFESHFQAYRVHAASAPDAFFTGYYQPELRGSLTRSAAFPTPVYGLPADLTTLGAKDRSGALADLTAARRGANGEVSPFPDRGAIEDGALEHAPGLRPLLYLRDNVDLFLIQVQGSARVRLEDGHVLHLGFAGRNGYPYTSIAKVLVQRGDVPLAEMSMRRLEDWLRQNGLQRGQPGDELLRLNRSYVFFTATPAKPDGEQPTGGSGATLTPLRSIAIDSHIWRYGLPFFIDAQLPWRDAQLQPFQRLMIAQDTGSSIVGAGRADIFFGRGETAGARAGEVRQHGDLYVLLPRD